MKEDKSQEPRAKSHRHPGMGILLGLLVMAGTAGAAVNVNTYFDADSEAAGILQMGKTGTGWENPVVYNSVGQWMPAIGMYLFTTDVSAFTKYDMTSLYTIWEDGAALLSNIQLGDKAMGDTLRAHRLAITGVHGADGAVVGTTDTLTLTNKTMDGDVNTFQDISGLGIKTTSWFKSRGFNYGTANTAVYFHASSSAAYINATDSSLTGYDRGMVLDARYLQIQDSSGGGYH